MTSSNRIWFLMARCLNGEALPEENEELAALLRADETLQQQYDLLRGIWGLEQEAAVPPAADIQAQGQVARILQLARVNEAMVPGTGMQDATRWYHLNRRKKSWLAGIAALLVLLTCCIFLFTGKRSVYVKSPQPAEVIVAQKGSRSQSRLPDGTVVWLNAGSSISYEENFSGPVREVKLEGEAYFDVARNVNKPFIVRAGSIDIRVLGTSFNVKSYPSDKTVETTLIHGLVQVTGTHDSVHAPVLLHPNEKLVVAKKNRTNAGNQLSSSDAINTVAADTAAVIPLTDFKIMHLPDKQGGANNWVETAWLYNRLAFRGDSFEELAPKLERWYNISIVFDDEKVKALNFNGSFENETVEQAFTALSAAVPFHFRISGRRVEVSGGRN
jgi:ferric-dicitrate binding protein FerR (iron transport regulator)